MKHVITILTILFTFSAIAQECKDVIVPTFGEDQAYEANSKECVLEINRDQLKGIKALKVAQGKVLFQEWSTTTKEGKYSACSTRSHKFDGCIKDLFEMEVKDNTIFIDKLQVEGGSKLEYPQIKIIITEPKAEEKGK